MKIETYVQENGKWVLKIQDVNRIKHYWYSLQVIVPYYLDRLKEKLDL